MTTTISPTVPLKDAHTALPHVFPSTNSARYMALHRERLGMCDVFIKIACKWQVHIDNANAWHTRQVAQQTGRTPQRFVESQFEDRPAAV